MVSRRSLSFDGKLFFLYDREAVRSEADPPENAIIYFYPTSATIDSRVSICGQLIGMSNFLSTVLDYSPVMINLKTEKVALYESEQYTLALGGSSSEPETLLLKQLQTLFDVFVFYHGSLNTVRKLSKDHASFLSNMSIIWDCYIHFIRHYGDTLPAVFNPLPFFQAPKNSSQRYFLKASHILQASQRRQHILGGCILHQKRVLCTQLEASITKRLLLLKPNQSHHPGKQVTTEIKLPFGVRFLDSFVTCCEYDRLMEMLEKSPYHSSIKSSKLRLRTRKSPKENLSENATSCEAGKDVMEATDSVVVNDNNAEEEIVGQNDNLQVDGYYGSSSVPDCEITSSSLPSTIGKEIQNLSGLNEQFIGYLCNTTQNQDADSSKSTEKEMLDNSSLDVLHCCDGKGIDDRTTLLNGVNSIPIDCLSTEDEDISDGFNICIERLSDEHDLSMEEIEISGLNIANGPLRDLTISDALDPQLELVCYELLDSLIEQVIQDHEESSKLGIMIDGEMNVRSREPIVDKTSDDMSCEYNRINTDRRNLKQEAKLDDLGSNCLPNGLVSNVQSDLTQDDCFCVSARDNSVGKQHGNSPTNSMPDVPINTLTNHPQEQIPTLEEFHDTVEDFETDEEITFTEKTVDAFLYSYHDLKSTDHTVRKYSPLNINQPDDKKVEKNLFNDLITTANHSAVSKGSTTNQDVSVTLQEVGSSLESGRESSLSYGASSQLSNPGPSGSCDSGLCLQHGSSESSLSQTNGSSNCDSSDLQQESSADFSQCSLSTAIDLETSIATLRDEEREEEQAEYVADFDESLYQIDGLVHVNLYVQAHSNTVLILLAESSLSQDHETIKALWKTTLNELGELEVQLNQCCKTSSDHTDRPDDYGFVVYDAISNTTKGNLTEPVKQADFKFCDTAKTVHEQFNNCTSLKSVTLRDNSAAIHCQRSLGQEVYFHKRGSLQPFRGSPSVRDSAFSLEKRARKQLKKDHGVNVI